MLWTGVQLEVTDASVLNTPPHDVTWSFSDSYLKSPAVNLASAKEKAASLITSPILVLVWVKEIRKQSPPLEKPSGVNIEQRTKPVVFNLLRWSCGGSDGSAWRGRQTSSWAGCGRSEPLSAEPSWWSEPCKPKQNTHILNALLEPHQLHYKCTRCKNSQVMNVFFPSFAYCNPLIGSHFVIPLW